MRILLAILSLVALSACETTSAHLKPAWSHYTDCVHFNYEFKEIAKCGEQKRNHYIQYTPKAYASEAGNRYVQWVNLLAQQVENGEISDATAKLKLMEKEDQFRARDEARRLQAQKELNQALRDFAKSFDPPKQTNCTTTGTVYGDTVTANTNCTTY